MVIGPTGHGAEKKELFEGEFALENVSLREAKLAFEIQRRENFTPSNNFFDVGEYCSAMALTTASPNASRFSSQVPLARLYGAYWTKQDITCLLGGATLGSVKLGMTISM